MPLTDDTDPHYQVPKRAVEVVLELTGKPPRTVQVFVPEHGNHADHQRAVLELLEHAEAFLPCRDTSSGQTVVFNKESLVWISVVPEALAEDDDELFEYRHDVHLELVGGQELAGELLYTLPHEHARVADYLNTPDRFARLWSGGQLYLVNKSFVERVVEVPLDLGADGDERKE